MGRPWAAVRLLPRNFCMDGNVTSALHSCIEGYPVNTVNAQHAHVQRTGYAHRTLEHRLAHVCNEGG
eukprot:1161432-Pelagomonas_calceolata.AAC.4